MRVDWTVNLPALITWGVLCAGLVWRAAKITTVLELLIERFESHVTEDLKRFDSLDDRMLRTQLEVASKGACERR
ncbi:MAG: hypothetical protein Q7T33_03550 [Dehalococcoidia bacterium]|nr:hypothetical protein [Dehalococcoidia bacterium]